MNCSCGMLLSEYVFSAFLHSRVVQGASLSTRKKIIMQQSSLLFVFSPLGNSEPNECAWVYGNQL